MKPRTCNLAAFVVAAPALVRPLTTARSLASALACSVTLSAASAQVGTSYCTPAPNSTGASAMISGSGSAAVTSNNLTLTSSNLPLNVAAYFLCSRDQGFVQNPGGSAGNLCLRNSIGRRVGGLIPNSGTTGMVSALVDVMAMPQPSGAVVVQAGETWNFQCWYRDAVAGGGSTSNFSDGLEVLFTGGGGPIPGMMPIPAGSFSMGSNAPNIAPYFNSTAQQPVHPVTISYPFWMGRYEVTQAEYQALMGVNPSSFLGGARPVERVSWFDARAYCAALTTQQASNLPAGYEYRLPTEAEWEYACRAGTVDEYQFGPALFCSQARFTFTFHTSPPSGCLQPNGSFTVGRFTPNAFGLYDMHGNVAEWCLDSFAPYGAGPVTDPFVTGGTARVVRGGSWNLNANSCRSASRSSNVPSAIFFFNGFRVVIAPVLVP